MKRSRIVVADNHANVREVMSTLLEMLDIEVLSCDGGEEVLKLIESSEVDAVISDVVMPAMDGMDLVEKLRERRPDIPVIMMSSYASEELDKEARSKGAVGLVAKPFKLESVTRLLKAAGVEFVQPG
jgi:CheY-like chemotaxis protein